MAASVITLLPLVSAPVVKLNALRACHIRFKLRRMSALAFAFSSALVVAYLLLQQVHIDLSGRDGRKMGCTGMRPRRTCLPR